MPIEMPQMREMKRRRSNAEMREAVKDVLVPYYRVSTEEQAKKGAGIPAQRAIVEPWAEFNKKKLLYACVDEGQSGSDLNRDEFQRALALVKAKRAGGIVVAKVDRLSRSLLDFADLLQQSQKEKWSLVCLDVGLDTSTPVGAMLAQILAVFAEFERRRISERTSEGMRAKQAQGVVLGRPSGFDEETLMFIIHLFTDLKGYEATARALNEEGIRTSQGAAQWTRTSVRSVLQSQKAKKLIEFLREAA